MINLRRGLVPLCLVMIAVSTVSGGTPPAFADTMFTPASYPRVDGSMATQPLGVAFQSLFTGSSVASSDVVFNQTDQAYHNLINGKADLILVTAPSPIDRLAATRAGIELEVIPVVDESFVFLTSASNPVTSLSVSQVRDIYSGKITNWSAVGGPNQPITAYQRPQNSLSQTGMVDLVMSDTPMVEPPTVQVTTTQGRVNQVAASFNGDAGSLGYSYYYYVTQMYGDLAANPQPSKIKLLGVDGVQPSVDTIRSGQYSLSTAYYIVINKAAKQNSPARRLAQAMLSHAGQQAALDAGYVPVDTSIPLPTPTPPDPAALTSMDETYAVNPLTFTTSTEYIKGVPGCTAVTRLTISGLASTSMQAQLNHRFAAMQNSTGQLYYTLPGSDSPVSPDTAGALPLTCDGVTWVDAQGNPADRGAATTPDYNSAVIDQASLLTLTGEASADFSNVLSLRTQLIPPRMMGVAAVTNTMNVRLDTGDDLTLSDVFTNGANIGGMIQLEAQASDPNCDEICANAKAAQFRANPNPSFNLTTSGVTVLGVTIPFASYWPQVAIFKRFAGVTGLSTVPSPARCQVISTQWDIARQACMPLKYQVADFGTVIVPAAGGSASTKLPVGLGQRWFVLHDSACSDETQATGVTPESGAGPTDLTVTAPSNTLPSNITTWACIMVIDPTTHLASFGQVQVIQDAMEPNWQVTVNPADGTTITTSAPQFSGVVTSTTDNTPVTSAFVAVNLAGTTTAICSDTTNSQGQWSCTAQIPLSNGPQPLSVQAQALAGWGRTDLTLNVDAPNAPGAPVITTPSAGQLIHATLPSGSGWLPQNVFIAGTADPSSHILITGGYVTDAGLTDVATTVVANQAGAWQTALTIYLLPGGSAQVHLAARSTFGQGVSPSTVTLAFMVTADGGYTIEIPATGYETDKVTVTRVDMQGKHKTATFTATATTVDPAVQVLTSNVTADNGTAELSFAATANGYHDVQIWVDGQPVPLAADGAPKPTSLSFVATPMPQTPPAAPIVNIANGFQIAGRAQAGSVVSLTYTVVDGTKTTTTPSDSDGQWELSTPPDAVDGPMTVTADNTIGTSNPATLRLDVIAPQPPMVADADKTHITGTTEAGAWVVVTYANGKPLGSTAADFTGNWVMKTPRWAPSGTIIVKATDRAGNQSEPTTATLTIAMSIGDDATPDPTTSSSEPTTILPSLTPIETEPAPGQTTITGTVLSGSEVKTTSTVDATADAAHTGGQVTNNGEPVLMIIAITLMIGAAVAARIRRRNQFL